MSNTHAYIHVSFNYTIGVGGFFFTHRHVSPKCQVVYCVIIITRNGYNIICSLPEAEYIIYKNGVKKHFLPDRSTSRALTFKYRLSLIAFRDSRCIITTYCHYNYLYNIMRIIPLTKPESRDYTLSTQPAATAETK